MKLSIKESLRFGWDTFKRRPWFFIIAFAVMFGITLVLDSIKSSPDVAGTIPGGVFSILNLVVGILLAMAQISLGLKAYDGVESLSARSLWTPNPFWKFTGAYLLIALIVLAGLILLIVPGVILAVMLMFTLYLVMDRKLGPIEALKESARITKGNRVQLFLFLLAIVGINILGLLVVFVGLLVTAPVTLIATAYAYRKLEGSHSAILETPIAEAA